MKNSPSEKIPLAAIDLGAHSARMLIAECGPKPQDIEILEDMDVSIPLGSNVFRSGSVDTASIHILCDIFRGFREKMKEYSVSRYRAIATSAVREAANADILLERIFHETGIEVRIFEGSDEARLDYLTVSNALPARFGFKRKSSMIADIGTGACQIGMYDHGHLSFTETIKLGTLRVLELMPGTISISALREHLGPVINKTFDELQHAGADLQGEQIIAMGASVRTLFRIYERNGGRKTDAPVHGIGRKEFDLMRASLAEHSMEDIVERFDIPRELAEAVMPCAIIIDNLFRITDAKRLIVPMVSMKQGLMRDFVNEIFGEHDSFEEQTLELVRKTALKYHCDTAYFEKTRIFAELLFQKLAPLHGLGKRELLILRIAAILHRAGLFISNQAYHKHSAYLIQAMEIPGLSLAERETAAFTVRYHRKSVPRPQHADFAALPAAERNTVMKLSAILRIAGILTGRGADPEKTIVRADRDRVLILTTPPRIFPERTDAENTDLDYFAHVFAVQATLQ